MSTSRVPRASIGGPRLSGFAPLARARALIGRGVGVRGDLHRRRRDPDRHDQQPELLGGRGADGVRGAPAVRRDAQHRPRTSRRRRRCTSCSSGSGRSVFGTGEVALRVDLDDRGDRARADRVSVRARARLALGRRVAAAFVAVNPVPDLVLAGGAGVHAAGALAGAVVPVVHPRPRAIRRGATWRGGRCARRSR